MPGMTDDWDFYFLRVEGAPASIQVDLGLKAHVPLAALPNMGYVRVHMNRPRPDGLSSQEEFETLIALEDALTAALVRDDTQYVGRCTSGGTRDLYYYCASVADWPQRVAAVFARHPEYRHDAGGRADPNWSVYSEFLHPSHEDRQRIENRRVCTQLEKHGDPLTAARAIDHWAYFRTAADAHAFRDEVLQLGFRVRSSSVDGERAHPHGLRVTREDVPSFAGIDDVVLPVYRAAHRHGGDYDGWECAVVRAGPEPA
jgi:hypothetical protein